MAHDKLLIVQPKVGKNQLNKFVKSLEDEGVKHIYIDPKTITDKKSKLKTVFTSPNADYVILNKDGKKLEVKKLESNLRFYQIRTSMEYLRLQKKDLIL